MRRYSLAALLALSLLAQKPSRNRLAQRPVVSSAATTVDGIPLPNGFAITPLATPGASFVSLKPGLANHPDYVAGQPMTMVLSPDGKTLLVLTSGYNRQNNAGGGLATGGSQEYVFLFDVSSNTLRQRQVLGFAALFAGAAWHPSGNEFYLSNGVSDTVTIVTLTGTTFRTSGTISLAHPNRAGNGLRAASTAAGVAINPKGDRLLVANLGNDSVSLLDIARRTRIAELDLRPGVLDPADSGKPGGEYPFWTAFRDNETAYVTSLRDREVIALRIVNDTLSLTARIPVSGNPNKMILNRDGSLLLVALDNADAVAVIDTESNTIRETIPTTAPASEDPELLFLKGSNPNSLALSPDEKTLYVTNAGTNSLAVIDFQPRQQSSRVTGLIPTGWYPHAVTLSADASTLFVSNAKNVAGSNSGACDQLPCIANNRFVLQLEKGGLLTLPVPKADTLAGLTAQVAANNNFHPSPQHEANRELMAALRERIRHVIYIIKENRTYDQVLGDLEIGNGDPELALFHNAHTPNHHNLARQFVTLDSFFDSGGVSGVGWNWSTAARVNDYTEKSVPPGYAGRLGSAYYDYEGPNRNILIGLADAAARREANPLMPDDPNILPGTADIAGIDSSEGESGAGYLWDGALRAGLSVRNYGFFTDLTRYSLAASNPLAIPLIADPYQQRIRQAIASNATLLPLTDPYYRGFDMNYPDLYRFREWAREFAEFEANGNLPALSLVALPHDHTGSYSTAVAGVNTPERQVADNDYALGLLIETLARSRYRTDTLVFIIEDDAQDGTDHVDGFRSIAFLAGPYVRQRALISTRYTTVNVVRTIKDVLGIPYFGLNDGTAEPMADCFDLSQTEWSFHAIVPPVLRSTDLPLPPSTPQNSLPDSRLAREARKPTRSPAWWARQTADQNFDKEDDLDTEEFNRVLWKGLKGAKPYPLVRHGRDLRANRSALLRRYR